MKWEYIIVTADAASVFSTKIDFESLQQEISQLGEEGWELVSTSDEIKTATPATSPYISKDPKGKFKV